VGLTSAFSCVVLEGNDVDDERARLRVRHTPMPLFVRRLATPDHDSAAVDRPAAGPGGATFGRV